MGEKKSIWRIPEPNINLQQELSAGLGISNITSQILINRGITDVRDANVFLNRISTDLHDPILLEDIEPAVARIRKAVEQREKIRVFGDYDVDGITSTTILLKVLSTVGAEVDYYIPGRLTEGYGMNVEAVSIAAGDKVSLIITVDNGISAVEEVSFAKERGIDVIITDHHEPPEILPPGVAIINPKLSTCSYPFKGLAGAGVALKLGQAILQAFDLPFQDSLIEFSALGTIADMVPLFDENRIIVRTGLTSMAHSTSPGIKALLEKCGIGDSSPDATQIAFQVAPRMNAAGRLGDANIAVKLLLSEDFEEATQLAEQLCSMNVKRQEIEKNIFQEAMAKIESTMDVSTRKVIVVAGENWHHGVIGIVASKLVQEYYRPVIILSVEDDVARGSARSITPFNMYDALKQHETYLDKYGGHSQAAGLTLPKDRIQEFAEAINSYAAQFLQEEHLIPEIEADMVVNFGEVDSKLYRELRFLAPFGFGNPEPLLVSKNAGLVEHRLVGNDGSHLKMRLSSRGNQFEAIGFRLGFHQPNLEPGKVLDVLYSLDMNEWRGRSTLQLNLKDISHVDQDRFQTEQGAFIEYLFNNASTFLEDDYYRDISEKDEFHTKIVGVTFEDRQTIVASLEEGQRLLLEREKDNQHDPNAIKVMTNNGKQVGYLGAKLAKHFAPLLDREEAYNVYVSMITGGVDKNYGVNVIIQKALVIDSSIEQARLKNLRKELTLLNDTELKEKIRTAILGENSYRAKQSEAMDSVYQSQNTLAIFGTGRGKSAVFQSVAAFKAIRHQEMTVIVYPLRALVNDQFENLKLKLKTLGLKVYRGNGSISNLERATLFEAIQNQDADILLTTPEFIRHHAPKILHAGRQIGLFVVDESHHIGISSTSHRPIYKQLDQIVELLGKPTVLAVTATANDAVAEQIVGALHIEKVIVDPYVRSNLHMVDKRDLKNKNVYLKNLIASQEKTIIYVNSRNQTVEIADLLRKTNPAMEDQIIFYHAGLTSEQRNKIEAMFRMGEVKIVVSTSAFGEGIDIPDVRHVVVYHLNFHHTEFNQQSGRCGRDGNEVYIHLLCGKNDANINRFILEGTAPDRDVLAKLYIVLRDLWKQTKPITVTNEELAKQLQKVGVKHAQIGLVSNGIGILDELGLIQREVLGNKRSIELVETQGAKFDLEKSLRFAEGQEELRQFEEFHKYFFDSSAEELLNFVNRPIFPSRFSSESCDIIK